MTTDLIKVPTPTIVNDITTVAFTDVTTSSLSVQKNAAYTKNDNCNIQGGIDSTSLVLTYYISQTKTYTLSLDVNSFSGCETLTCETFRLDEKASKLTTPYITYDTSQRVATVFTTNTTYDGKSFDIYYRAIKPLGMQSNCVLNFKALTLNMLIPTIKTTSINNINY